MLGIVLQLDGDGAYSDLRERTADIIHLGEGAPPIGLTALAGGMTSGRASVMLRIDLPDGRVVLAETSLRLLQTVVAQLTAHYGQQ